MTIKQFMNERVPMYLLVYLTGSLLALLLIVAFLGLPRAEEIGYERGKSGALKVEPSEKTPTFKIGEQYKICAQKEDVEFAKKIAEDDPDPFKKSPWLTQQYYDVTITGVLNGYVEYRNTGSQMNTRFSRSNKEFWGMVQAYKEAYASQ